MTSNDPAPLAAKAHSPLCAQVPHWQKNSPFLTRAAVCCLFVLLFSVASVALAQNEARDYAITTPLVNYSSDGASAIVTLTVTNQGSDAVEESTITIAYNDSGRIVESVDLPPLASGEVYPFSAELKLDQFPDGDVFLKIEVGIDQYELAGSPIARDNSQLFRINVAEAREAATVGGAASFDSVEYDFVIPLLNIGVKNLAEGIQINDSIFSGTQILVGILVLALGLVLLWFISLILRLIFRTSPSFDVWQPPYAAGAVFDPDSTQGRRQSWQYHAQNSAINAPCTPNHLVVVKRLVNAEGRSLDSWMIKAIRSEQYDIYGRISHSEAIMPRKFVKQLNKIAGRSGEMDNQQLHEALNPIANRMSKAALRRIEKQNRSLPIALDIRFEGVAGEAHIVFELYQCRNAAWHLIDQWEPELGMIGGRIPEQFTYALNGMLPGENYREFKARIPHDLTHLLGGLLYHHQPPTEAGASPAAGEQDVDSTSESNLDEPSDDTTEANNV
ncbi:MAG: hypothetical protein OXG39_00915 [Chloroflexi bacterium]|nr:hypothetical protein [Chloroflexota bacterium]